MRENVFSKLVLAVLNRHGHGCRVESPEVSAGIPDLSYCVLGAEGFLELKEGNKPKLRPDQYRWIKKRVKAGGRVAILWHDEGVVHRIPPESMEDLKGTTSRRVWAKAAADSCLLDRMHLGFITGKI
jgi:hypothetical protein